ncbi:hypothetical protein [Teichococcus aestuarii]|uniref:hypothetical protein n=1 Tax=Teichococcus aestuarii TaxID=568898 RepID=UPI003619BFEE
MITTASLLGLPGAGIPLRALGPDHAGRVALSRAGAALVQDAAGLWQAAAADTPRFHGPARRLLVEAGRTNSLRNPRCEGAAAGTLPSTWSLQGSPANLVLLGPAVLNGIPGFQLQVSGTGNGLNTALTFDADTSVPTTATEIWAASFFVALTGGSLAGLSNIQLSIRTAGGTASPSSLAVSPGATLARPSLTTVMGSGTTGLVPRFYFTQNAGAAINATFFLGAPQLERGEVATSPVLPPAGAPAASSRSADAPIWSPPGGLGGAGTVVVAGMLPNAAAFGASQGLLQIDDGTDANRLLIRNTSGGSEIFGVVDSGGATLAALPGGNMVPGTPFRAALAWAQGEVAFCLNGGTVQSAAVTPPAGLVRMLVGHASTALNRAANGEVALIDHRPLRLPDAMLQAVSAAG